MAARSIKKTNQLFSSKNDSEKSTPMIKRTLFLLLFLTASLTQAQDMFQEYLFSADLVMKNRDKISLTDAQADRIKKIHSTNAAEFSTLKWDLDAATGKLKNLLNQSKPDAVAVSKQLDLVLSIENQLKKKQLATLVAIKNELTETQQTDLKKTKVMGRVTSWEYVPEGVASSISGTSTKLKFGVESPKSSSSNETRSVTGTTNSRVYVQRIMTPSDPAPTYYLKKDNTYQKIPIVSDINPNDIEAIEVLKGEKAIEKFGENGRNGAIIITLKEKKEEAPLEN
jgi:Spy/CpxP family protein refolding chaperone